MLSATQMDTQSILWYCVEKVMALHDFHQWNKKINKKIQHMTKEKTFQHKTSATDENHKGAMAVKVGNRCILLWIAFLEHTRMMRMALKFQQYSNSSTNKIKTE